MLLHGHGVDPALIWKETKRRGSSRIDLAEDWRRSGGRQEAASICRRLEGLDSGEALGERKGQRVSAQSKGAAAAACHVKWAFSGEKSFCSRKCRDQEILTEEEENSTAVFSISSAGSSSSLKDDIFMAEMPEEARVQINCWVAAETHNLVDSILPENSVKSETSVVVSTALYFKGSWDEPFKKYLTKEGKFQRLDGSTVDAKFLRSQSHQFITTHEGFKVLKMPYALFDRGNNNNMLRNTEISSSVVPPPQEHLPEYSMVVLLPDARDGLSMMEDKMASSPDFLQKHLPKRAVKVGDFQVPKFKLSFTTSAKVVLEDLGIKTMFHPMEANLQGILEDDDDDGFPEPLYVDDIFHKAVIKVDGGRNRGCGLHSYGVNGWRVSLVGAAQAGGLRCRSSVCLLYSGGGVWYGAILFAGHVHDPTKS
ncbi:hypothetical protein BS78_K144500 [Paspalum vaginatum]|uniref:Serpin domain-containing protein n=1 Tax=Paspalum vaginatum TaxID=158149 RepID=A0A9W7XC34_9POAL|nr:hypothetical protein BS78_K144500 [Paspalum vaginatum]